MKQAGLICLNKRRPDAIECDGRALRSFERQVLPKLIADEIGILV